MLISVRFGGVGGQGIIFSGIALARAAALYEKKGGKELFAVQTQSYGPEARGGTAKCDVRISNRAEFYPFVEKPDFLVLMSQPAYEQFIQDTKSDTIVVLDADAVVARPDLRYYEVPAIRKARELQKPIIANIIMLGAFVYLSKIISKRSMIQSLRDISPSGTFELNREAFDIGFKLGKALTALH
ncbi:MAG: 2-oxoacid:acceptor oxidoreductase family protein [Methanomassiliicoccales archaeon]|jgi:2-oxoglutarate ferredoxin oxidoreductase subunit gamma|nr:2-oxoacid:acceptor oxidoreductase family protein [Methanomassiliicoccales archaeon]